jgi:hypothetical protein
VDKSVGAPVGAPLLRDRGHEILLLARGLRHDAPREQVAGRDWQQSMDEAGAATPVAGTTVCIESMAAPAAADVLQDDAPVALRPASATAEPSHAPTAT